MDEALKELRTKPSIRLWPTWAVLAGVGRSTAYALAARGEIEGAFKVGAKYRIAAAPWRRRLGIEEAA